VGEQLIERGRDLLGRSPLHGRRGLVNDLHCVPYRGVHACQCREALAGLDVYYPLPRHAARSRRRQVFAFVVFARRFGLCRGAATDTPAVWEALRRYSACCRTKCAATIDRLDREIVRLIAARNHYVQKAARFKVNRTQVEAAERAEAVVLKAMTISYLGPVAMPGRSFR
jgi:hypothetical protein